jgi:hypothetical protein
MTIVPTWNVFSSCCPSYTHINIYLFIHKWLLIATIATKTNIQNVLYTLCNTAIPTGAFMETRDDKRLLQADPPSSKIPNYSKNGATTCTSMCRDILVYLTRGDNSGVITSRE